MRMNRTFLAFSAGLGVAIAAIASVNACLAPEDELEAPIAPAPVEVPVDPADPRQAFIQGLIEQGDVVGTVIVCEPGWTASVDTTPDGFQWAACM